MRLWVVIPARNEARVIAEMLAPVVGTAAGCVVVDAGSDDHTTRLARAAGATVICAPAGRAVQMNAGAREALAIDPDCDHLLFVHADCSLPRDWLAQVSHAAGRWGRFDVQLVAPSLAGWRLSILDIIAWFMNQRSARTGICTGDQGLLVPVATFQAIDGFATIPLMEDVEISRRLRRVLGQPVRLTGPMRVSARRWEERGVLQTMIAMFAYRLRYFLGESPESLHDRYYGR